VECGRGDGFIQAQIEIAAAIQHYFGTAMTFFDWAAKS
jgi:hypothetical protein